MYRINFIIIILSFILTGCFPAIFTATTSSTIAAAKDQSISETIDDIKISTKIKASFMKNNFRELYTKIKVEVEQGRVLLTGTIDKKEEALKAVELVWDITGVSEVINELIIDKKSDHFDLVQYTKDAIITSQIKARTFIKRDIKWVNYTIVTVNNIVYIFGLARSEEELEMVTSIASQINGVERVICHVKMKETKKINNEHDINESEI
ncbi:MAG: BON domain-containing protein [Rickettsia endosymbiont of Culicoides impunctatus]|uniref:BON domain-containing protein n=1 Tax=unclassified Candidatus Tisiphia TaxID=2996318 RepID=UPI001E7E05DD|nr:MAG: BON domain-containing protein [Rickettsia endosymbiont of Culicoides impunctatus]